MGRPKKTDVEADAPQTNGNGVRTHEDDPKLPLVPWLTLVRHKGGYAVLKAHTLGKEVVEVTVLHGPMARTAASAALRTEMARAFLLGKGPQ